jgi:hypothetical protein
LLKRPKGPLFTFTLSSLIVRRFSLYNSVRGFFVVLLTASAIGKYADMPGFYRVVETYQVLPAAAVALASQLLAFSELALAAALAWSSAQVRVASLVVALHLMYLFWLALALWKGLDIPNCGCFGVYFPRPLSPWTLVEDGVLLGLALLLWRGAIKSRSTNAIGPGA